MYLNPIAVLLACIWARLTLTWDVFKFSYLNLYIWGLARLTLTWDVFKSPHIKLSNINF